jgi:hypothetical protein
MDKENLQELIRLLNDEGCGFKQSENCVGSVSAENRMIAIIENDGCIHYKHDSMELAIKIRDLYSLVDEYMSVFQNAASHVEKFSSGGQDDTRTLLFYNGHELAGRKRTDDSMEFVTWERNGNGTRHTGRYFDNYIMAKQDFAVRTGLIERDRLFSEKELAVIRSHLSEYLDLDSKSITGRQEDAINDVISKIDDVIAPEIQENILKAEELGYEPEQEL